MTDSETDEQESGGPTDETEDSSQKVEGEFLNAEVVRQRVAKSLLTMMTFVAMIGVMLMIIAGLDVTRGAFIGKEALQNDLTQIIDNGGDLRAIKQAYLTHPRINSFEKIISFSKPTYPATVALSSVLADIRVQAFRDDKRDSLTRLGELIEEYEEVNPFDKLEVGQKDYFENIRIKTGDNYPAIRNDINNLVDELHQQNLLVGEYLSDSKKSFWISIVAVLLSVAVGIYQILVGRQQASKDLVPRLTDAFAGLDRRIGSLAYEIQRLRK